MFMNEVTHWAMLVFHLFVLHLEIATRGHGNKALTGSDVLAKE